MLRMERRKATAARLIQANVNWIDELLDRLEAITDAQQFYDTTVPLRRAMGAEDVPALLEAIGEIERRLGKG